MQDTTGNTEFIDAPFNSRINLKRRSVERLATGINHQAAMTTPVLNPGKRLDAFKITRRSGAGESDP